LKQNKQVLDIISTFDYIFGIRTEARHPKWNEKGTLQLLGPFSRSKYPIIRIGMRVFDCLDMYNEKRTGEFRSAKLFKWRPSKK
jgi:hypothetical protein